MNHRPAHAPAGFSMTVAGRIRQLMAEQFAQDPRGATPLKKAHLATLRAASDYAAGLGDANGTIVALWKTSSLLGSSTAYTAGSKQTALLHVVGMEDISSTIDDQPGPEAVLAGLVAAAFEDASELLHRPAATAIRERDQAVNQLRRLQDRTVDRSELAASRMETDAARATCEAIAQENRHLKEMLGMGVQTAPVQPEPEPEPEDDGREVTVAEGIVRRPLATGGFAFMARWRDAEGKPRKRQFASEPDATAYRKRMLEEREEALAAAARDVPDLTTANAAGPEVN